MNTKLVMLNMELFKFLFCENNIDNRHGRAYFIFKTSPLMLNDDLDNIGFSTN